jgi:hypothetical protein
MRASEMLASTEGEVLRTPVTPSKSEPQTGKLSPNIARRLNDGGCGNRSEARLCHLGFGITFHLGYSGGPIMTVTWLLVG